MSGLGRNAYANSNRKYYSEWRDNVVVGEKLFSAQELDELTARGRKMIVIHGNVCDVTDYLHHPGGLWFRNRTFDHEFREGYDRTIMFEETNHSDDTRENLVAHYRVGYLPPSEGANGAGVYTIPKQGEFKFPGERDFVPINLRKGADMDYSLEYTLAAAAIVMLLVGIWK